MAKWLPCGHKKKGTMGGSLIFAGAPDALPAAGSSTTAVGHGSPVLTRMITQEEGKGLLCVLSSSANGE